MQEVKFVINIEIAETTQRALGEAFEGLVLGSK